MGFFGLVIDLYLTLTLHKKTYTYMSFDAREAKLLKPGEHLTSPEHAGLRLERSTRTTAWIYRYRSLVDDKLRQIKIGSWPAMSVHAAIAEWEQLRNRRNAGEDPAQENRAVRQAEKAAQAQKLAQANRIIFTVEDVCDFFWRGYIQHNRAKKGATETKRMFATMLGDLADVEAATLTRAQAFNLIQSCAEKSPVQAGRLRSELGAAWDYAIDAGRLPETAPNWWRLILRGRIKSRGKKIGGEHVGTTKRVLTPAEAGALIRWLPNFTNLVDDVLTLYLWTATRGAEIVGMRGLDVQKGADGQIWWTIPKDRTKNARHENATDLRVPLFGRAVQVVMRRKELYGDGYLFLAKVENDARPVEQKTIQSAVWYHQPYSNTRPTLPRPRLPVTYWAPHDLRRTSRTFLAALGCPDEIGEMIIGHIKPGVKGTYNLYDYDAERVVWLKRLSDYLESLAQTIP